ncbi:uncharacterized protein BDV17DRAFT_294080 [Aspergillus undulatus]|uniref:uncharacterized protein n=1 Tax=Aspergillus undulatus TaxID=1810928 RepID=UPI003CCD0D3E
MEDPMMDPFLGWETEELTEFSDFFGFDLFEAPIGLTSPTVTLGDPAPSIEDIPELTSDHQPAAQDDVDKLNGLVSSLLDRVTALESQLESESLKRDALECYVEELQPFLSHLASTRHSPF